MTEQEFDVLDELYFVVSFGELKEQTAFPEEELKEILAGLLKRGWVKCLINVDDEVPQQALDFEQKYSEYYYLATKQGLFAHNRQE